MNKNTLEVKPYDEIMEQLMKESLAFAAYINEENKFLIAKGPYFDRFSLPCTKVTNSETSAYAYLNPILRKEFGINARIKDYLELVRGFYKINDEYKIGNLICFFCEEYYEYPGKPNLTPEPEIFSEAKYVSFDEAKELYSRGEITEYTMYYLSRIQEKVELLKK